MSETPIVVPFTELHPATEAALEPHRERVRYVDVSEHGAYWELFRSLWARSEDLILIEHDVEIGPDTIERFDCCEAPWCTSPYWWERRPGYAQPSHTCWAGLGCVRFRAALMRRVPELGDQALLQECHPEAPDPPYEYQWVDGLQGGILTLDHELTPCQHEWVAHHQRMAAPV